MLTPGGEAHVCLIATHGLLDLVEQRDLATRHAVADQLARFIDDIARLVEIGKAGKDADRLTRPDVSP